jgi:hypothetical protein
LFAAQHNAALNNHFFVYICIIISVNKPWQIHRRPN